jgi:hypothetical protein
MKKSTAFVLSGAGLGLFIGSSMGVAVGGNAYNAAFFLSPIGAYIGWLLVAKNSTIGEPQIEEPQLLPEKPTPASLDKSIDWGAGFEQLIHSALAIMASLWNFHIEILRIVGLLPTFARQPLLFLGLCVVIYVVFPPFLIVYFCAWLGASHFGQSTENQFKVTVQ